MRLKNSPIVLIIILMAFSACQRVNPIPIESGVSKILADHRKATITNVEYDVTFSIPNSVAQPISGGVTIRFDLENLNQPVVLDFENEKNGQIILLNKEQVKVDFEFQDNHLIIPDQQLKVGTNIFTLAFSAGEQALNRNEDFLYTLFVPNKASTAFPCFDQPNIKAKYKLTLQTPKDWTALANYPLINKKVLGQGAIYTYEQTPPISTYLFAFTTGKFQTITDTLDGVEMTLYHRETDTAKVARNAPEVFDLHLKSIRWLEEYTGIKQPFKKFDFALIPAFQFGGMEHVGAIFYKDRSLFLEENATINQKMSRNSLIAHETAHMWFGNLVTMDWFNDVWLKEVFANFMAAKMVNPNFPDINHDLRFLMRHHPSAYGEDRSAGGHPIQQNLENLNQASLLYGRIIYQKAPVVMKQLEAIMGEENFRQGLQEYLTTYSFDNATWDDLIVILDKRTDLDLKTWSQAWVKETGMPWLKANLTIENDKIASYELAFQNTTSGGNIWQENSTLLTSTNGQIQKIPLQMLSEKTEVKELVGQPNPDFILPHVTEKAYGFFELDEKSQNYLLANIQNVDDEMTKSAAWFSLYESMLRGQIPPLQILEALLNSLPKEQEIQGLSSRLGYLHTTFWGFLSPENQLANAEKIEKLLWELFQKADNAGRKKTLFDTYVAITRSSAGIQRLQDLWSEKLVMDDFTLSENEFTTLAYELAVRNVAGSDTILQQQLKKITNPDRKAAMAFIIPGLSNDESVRDAFFNSLKQEENRAKEPWVGRALQYLHHPLRAVSAEKYIIPSLELVQEIQQTGGIFFPKRWSQTILNGHSSVSAAQKVHQFLEDLPADYPMKLKNKILQSADMLERKALIISQNNTTFSD
ncbi:MAG: M1 family aminopeptidase [Bacteroidota bacterium]